MTQTTELDTEHLYKSNKGHGPYVARINSIIGGTVYMERWNENSGKKLTEFSLPLTYMLSKSCGWKQCPNVTTPCLIIPQPELRALKAYALWKQRKKLREIGLSLGVSSQRASQLVKKGHSIYNQGRSYETK